MAAHIALPSRNKRPIAQTASAFIEALSAEIDKQHKAPPGCAHADFIDSARSTTRNIIARWNYKARKSPNIAAVRLVWYRGLDPSHNLNPRSLQNMFNRAVINAAARHYILDLNPHTPTPLHAAFGAAMREAEEEPASFAARDRYVNLWNNEKAGEFWLLNAAEEGVWYEFLESVWGRKHADGGEEFPYERSKEVCGVRMSSRLVNGLDAERGELRAWFRVAVEQVLEDGDVAF
ncbi:uncharacterized protein BDZ99DRAFT_564811 [Mytilinidion resinicola]|uniref:Uncharacterized protein n=1 Tax=Mytilinidion resinicola TaxID=574789 RepID=A0A6A6Z9W6_9PEZI|nr:uncharacterized protein BDZ99DRAFT_564811 [Mytilinidion resinicola]KAF2816997.1 hypothetical protein BDZ99DRAFT_564811 [Mytilinidion resinicola]